MKITQMLRNKNTACAAAVLIGLLIGGSFVVAFRKGREPAGTEQPAPGIDADAIALACAAPQSALRRDQVRRISLAVRGESPIALVQFESDYQFPKEKLAKDKKPLTASDPFEPDLSKRFRIAGQFALLKALHGSKVEWDRIDRTISTDGGDHWGRVDPTYSRLCPLMRVARRGEPGLFLAVSAKKTCDPLDCDFIGPISFLDYKRLPEMIDTLAKTPFNMIGQQAAEELLRSPNLWQRMLGLEKLDDLHQLRPHHAGTALRNSGTTDEAKVFAPALLSPMTYVNCTGVSDDELAKAALAADAAPFLQEVVIRQFLWTLENPGYSNWYGSYLESYKKAIREYLPSVERDPARALNASLLQTILKFEPAIK